MVLCFNVNRKSVFTLFQRYYETCTRALPPTDPVDLNLAYWCPSPGYIDGTTLAWTGNMTNEPESYGLCTENAQPPENGCEDHYDPVRF